MALWKVTTSNNSKLVYVKKGGLKLDTSKYPNKISTKRFKYLYKGEVTPGILKIQGEVYLMPEWVKVHPNTTLNDVEWVKPKPKNTKPEVEVFTFESSSSSKVYTTKKTTYHTGKTKYSCNCFGFFRSKDKRCTHIKQIEK